MILISEYIYKLNPEYKLYIRHYASNMWEQCYMQFFRRDGVECVMEENINFHTCVYKDYKIWFVSTNGYFMNIDTSTFEISFVYANGNKIFNQVTDPMLDINDNLYWVEQKGQRLLQYDIKTNHCSAYDMPESKMVDWTCFSMITQWNDQVFIFPKYTDKIIMFDTKTKRFSEYNDIYIKYGMKNSNEAYLMHASVRENLVLLFLSDMQTVLFYSMSNKTVVKAEKMFCRREIVSSFWKDENLFIHEKEGDIYILNSKLEEIKKLEINAIIGKSYVKMVSTNTKIFLLPAMETDILEYDLNNNSITIKENPQDLIYHNIQWGKYLGDCRHDNLLWMANRMSNYILCIDEKKEDIYWRKIVPLCTATEAKYCTYIRRKYFMKDRLELFINLGIGFESVGNSSGVGETICKRINE